MAPPHKTSQSDQKHMKHNLLKSLIISVILLTGVSNAWGTVVGMAGDNPNNYTVKINVNRFYKDGGNDWLKKNIDQAPKNMTFEGKKLYITNYDNTNIKEIETMQFQYYNGNDWKEEVLANKDKISTDNGAFPYGCIFNYDKNEWYGKLGYVNGANFYFDASDWDETSIQLCIGHANWQAYYPLTKIDNTRLYYIKHPGGWGDAMGICVVGNTTATDGQNLLTNVSDKAKEFTGFKHWGFEYAGNTAYFMVNKGDRGEMPDMYYYGNYNSFNHVQTIKTAIKNANGNYVVENSKATITIKSYKITGNGVATEQNNSLTTSSNTATISAARTATTTLTVNWGSLDPNYKFEGWYDENGTQLETKLTYTYYPTEENTIYARFSESPSLTVYFRPNKVWNKPGDRFAIYWTGTMQNADEMQQIGCSEYYQHEIPGKYVNDDLNFQKIKSDAGIFDSWDDIDKDAGETANLKIPAADDPKKLYDISKVYLKPDDTWKSDGARFAAYFWVSGSNPVQEKWMSMSPSPENDGTYYCDYPTDHAYDHVKFSRMNPANTDNNFNQGNCWNSTTDLSLYNNNKKGYGNLFQINSIDNGEWTNKWTTYTATTTVTLVADSHGTYKVTCSNGTSLTSALNENRTLSVPLNSTITIETVQPQPGYAQIHGAAITIGTNSKQAAILGNAYAICGATTITGNFVAEKGTIYLEANASWNTSNARFFAHVWHDTGEQDYEMTSIGKYFSCTLEDDYHSIVFYRKNPDGNTIWCQTNDLFIPTDNQRIYEITSFGNGKIGDNDYTPAEGTWKKATALIKIDPCEYGQFGIVLENETIWCDKTEVKPIEVPLGTTIKIIDFTDSSISNPEYKLNPRYTYSTIVQIARTKQFINLDDIGLDYTVTEDIWVVPNIVTKNPHTVYLHIPDNLISQWNGNTETYKYNTMYLKDYLSDGQIIRDSDQEYVAHLLTAKKDEDLSNFGGGEYWRFDILEEYHTFIIERKTNNNDDNTGEGGGDRIRSYTPTFYFGIPLDENIVYTLRSYEIDTHGKYSFKGTWGPLPTCTITAFDTHIGRYGIKYNDEIHYATPGHTETFEVPYGAEVEVLYGEPGDNTYNGNVIMYEGDGYTDIEKQFEENEPVTITKHRWFDDNFTAIEDEIVYLGIPSSILEKWTSCDNPNHTPGGKVQPYIFDHLNDVISYEGNPITYEGITYYKFTVPDGFKNFQFQAKNSLNTGWQDLCAQTADQLYPPLQYANCFMLDGLKNGNDYTGYWERLNIPEVGDYRVLYAEKKLIKTHEEGESEDWETAFQTIYSHPSDVIRKRTDLTTGKDTVSLHIYTQRAYDTIPMVILQQYQTVNSTNQWVDIEAHTVLPLKAHGNMGMLPGRKKAYGELPFYSDGIDAIKDDLVDKGSGVWNFIVEQAKDENTKNMTTTLHLGKDKLKRYEGTYYIRTTNTLGGWINYYNEDNHMKFSSYSKQYRGFSHYYCKWVDITKHSEDVRFVVANDYGSAISKELIADTYSNSNGEITENANIRWSWNIVNNKVSRAYIQGTWNTNSQRLDNIVAKYKTNQSASDSRELLDDTGDWIYSKDIKNVQVGSQLVSLTAQYPSDGDTQIFAKDMDMLVGDIGQNQNNYVVRILYDFKIDKTMVTLVPDENNADIAIDVLIERIDQGEATQVRSNITNNYKTITNANGETETGATVYAMMTFNKAHLTNPSLSVSDQRRFTYWISFPFDVNIADVFGFSEYGKQWRIRTYDSQARAENGYDGTQTYWKYIDINQTPVLEANKGYILVLNAKLRNPEHSAYTNRSSLSLYFPSANLINDLDTACIETSVVVPRNEGQAPSKDWNWNMIGVPSYANKDRTISQDHLYYFFEYNYDTDSYEVCWAGKEQTFKSMFAYMVQFAGTIDWTNFKVYSGQFPEQLAAKKDASAEINHVMRLELLRNNQREDKTYIQLTENENATEQFDMNFDLTKMANAKANLYSLIGNHQLAANVLPLQTTIVPLGVIIKTAGEYTFSMPDGTAGIIAELIDYQTNTRTNLLLDNYTVTLPAGTNNSRFALSLQPDKTVTSVDNIGNEATGDKVKKYLIDGVLYMQKGGVLYDAQGKLVR